LKILVTGGVGYIGSIVSARLVEAGHDVIVYDLRAEEKRSVIPSGSQAITGDVADREKLDALFQSQRIDAVMHFAAWTEVGESMKRPEAFFQNNTFASLTLLDAMMRANVKQFLFSSTAAVYGNPERTPILETDALRPNSVYGMSKLMVEQMLEWFCKVRGLRYASLRYFNAAGAEGELGEDHVIETHLIPLAIQVALGKRKSISVFGQDYQTPDGTCIRDFIHVSDIADAHLLALEGLKSQENSIYNLGDGIGYSVRDVISAVRRVTGHAIPCDDAPRRNGDPAVLVASSQKIKNELGWQPKFTNLEDIIRSAWIWHKKYPDGFGAD
jgi:UDP-glucose 4-epimerase